ncbi:uncharacterized protein N7479_000636 [Penicillium vulpinum]|uniref:GED domain-containing protein n=1 Tax=Penicillium vulpinum TaxID=29845 RepID=A0A1V6S682_9EURO|nr:uncharacterized protein N7479_000636 [Penicillium vulpinum]KAJ5970718.1 hypothetical protein N7479_000636 [Penicillium vulpinum]OQE09244.1 hypothetical protein PENVUL_c007G04782 [Penicillium vulpinum]
MPDPAEPGRGLSQPQTDPVSLLDTIDKLRTLGVGEFVSLPQMIVCGSKSNGKRSIIEAISRVGFPMKNDLYSGFVMEIILRRHPTPRFKVSIEPGPSRKSDKELQQLKAFEPVVHANTEQSASLIGKATEFLGPSTEGGFSDDTMKVEVSGPDQPDLTLIDMPGCYFTEGTDDRSQAKDPGRLHMEKYMLNPRSIILPVVSAKIDICVQKILDFADKYDAERNRIMGIVTHLDTLEALSDEERLWMKAVKETTTELPLGLHLVCTRSYETRNVQDEEREEKEKQFFEGGEWKTMSRQSVGTGNLRRRLSTLLMNHVRNSIPGLISELDKIILKNQSELAKLNIPRETIHQRKALLFNLSSAFQRITQQALNGMYTDDFFAILDESESKVHDPRRLRATLRDLNEDFADIMEIAGCRQYIYGVHDRITPFIHPRNPYANIRWQARRSRSEFESEVSEKMRRDRGIELPGNGNQLLVGSLFRDQSQPWEEIARAHLMKSWESTLDFVTLLLDHLADEGTSVVILQTIIRPQLDRMEEDLLAKLHELTAYYKRGHPLPMSGTFLRAVPLPLDRSFLAKMQKSKNDRLLANLQKSLPSTMNNTFNKEELKVATQNLESLSNRSAASDIVDQFQAYYNTSLLIFMDNIATLAIENCLLAPLDSVLTTQTITNMEDNQIEELFAGVHEGVQKSRDYVTCELAKLQTGLRELKQFNIANQSTLSTGTIENPGSSSAYGCSPLHSFLTPQGILCNGAPSNPFGILCMDSTVRGENGIPGYQLSWPYNPAFDKEASITPCPSGPLGLNPGMVNAGTATAPFGSFSSPNAIPSTYNSGAPASFKVAPPLPSTATPSSFWSPTTHPFIHPVPYPAPDKFTHSFPYPTPDTRSYNRDMCYDEKENHGINGILTTTNRYHSICYHPDFKYFSHEELRLADYQLDAKIKDLFQPAVGSIGRN